ncbi:hypothetical protein Tco_1002169 [Tanacetum coccineum]|uniref:Xylulose kinase-1 n=1 Tax=Tanacetum coccineum TaxID=301880 RepID=A0ABQ5F5K0_9ASTR
MVAYLDKSTKNVDFDEIVDFLNANPIRYALTVSPTIYVSYIEQFWSTVKTKTVNNETQIHAKVDGKTIVITKSFVRRDLHFNDEDDEIVHKERGDSMERAATTAISLDAEQVVVKEPDTILGDRPAQTSINFTTTNEPVITASAPIATAGVSVSTAEPSTPPTTTTFIEDEDLIISQTLMKMRSVKSKEKSKEKRVSSETATRLTRGVIMKEASETATRPIVPPQKRPIVPPQQQLDPKDKGKGIIQEPKKPVKMKGKDQIKYDADMAKRLQAELDEEVGIERKREEEASNVALIEE